MAAPTKVTGLYNAAAVAPHGNTQRLTYTVPAGRFCIIETVLVHVLRDAAPGAAAVAGAYITLTPSGGAVTRLVQATMVNATLGSSLSQLAFGQVRLKAGDVLAGFSVDTSTGGTYSYTLSFSGTEYDE